MFFIDEDQINMDDWLDSLEEDTVEIKCECGAHKTSNPNLHADWCPLYVSPM